MPVYYEDELRICIGASLTVRQGKAISNDSDGTSLEVIAVDLVPQARRRTEILEEAIQGVGEVEIAVLRADDQVVERAELAAEVVVDES